MSLGRGKTFVLVNSVLTSKYTYKCFVLRSDPRLFKKVRDLAAYQNQCGGVVVVVSSRLNSNLVRFLYEKYQQTH